MVASDYENPSYVNTQLDLIQPTDPGRQYYELHVTDLVLADYAADGLDLLSAFRLKLSEAILKATADGWPSDSHQLMPFLTCPIKGPSRDQEAFTPA